jgi:hypothetical protein
MFGHMRLLGSGPYPALLVPDQAVVTDQTRQAVYVVGPDGMVSERMVNVGPIADGLRVIHDGLSAGDVVIIDGIQRARPGHKVSVQVGAIKASAVSPGATDYATPLSTSAKIADPAG